MTLNSAVNHRHIIQYCSCLSFNQPLLDDIMTLSSALIHRHIIQYCICLTSTCHHYTEVAHKDLFQYDCDLILTSHDSIKLGDNTDHIAWSCKTYATKLFQASISSSIKTVFVQFIDSNHKESHYDPISQSVFQKKFI